MQIAAGLTLFFSIATLAGAATPQASPGIGGRPNVLFVMVDQLSARALGSYGNGFGGVSGSLTPELDQLAAEGVRFENAMVCSPQCVPSRFAVITGRWPHASGLRKNKIWAPRDQTTILDVARAAGYVTGTVGKHHFYWLEQSQPLAEDHGFDVIVDEDDYGQFCVASGVPSYVAPGNFWAMPGLSGELAYTGFTNNTNEFHPCGYFTDQALEFIDARAGPGGDGEPFFLFYSLIAPHTPMLPSGPADPMDWAHRFHPFDTLDLAPNIGKVATTTRLASSQANHAGLTDLQHKEILSYYYGLIAQVDWNVGRVLQRLDDLSIADETVVIFTSDHGEMATEMSCWLKGTGGYDAVTRVPVIMRLPGIVPPGLVTDELTTNLDLFPTLVELTGLPLTEPQRDVLDGKSLVDIAVGLGAPSGWPAAIFSEFGLTGSSQGRYRSVRTLLHKYVFDELGGGEEEYYDLGLDPWEIDDRVLDPSPQTQAIIQNLRGRLDTWWNGEQGHAPLYQPTGFETARPLRAANPVPADGAQGVSRFIDPSFLPSTSSDTIEVHLGTDPASLALFRMLPAMSASFNPGTLSAATDYYWRVDQTNDNGTTPGPVWHFRTVAGGSGGGDLATAPSPADLATGVALQPTLAWTVGPATAMQVLYFGRAGEVQPVRALFTPDVTSLPLGPLEGGVRYQWRIDSFEGGVFTTGDVWSFETTFAGLPARATPGFPLHMADDVPPANLALSWMPGAGALSHDVYFGTSFPLALQASQVGTSFVPPAPAADTTYYWRVDGVGADGTTRGFTWRFRTE